MTNPKNPFFQSTLFILGVTLVAANFSSAQTQSNTATTTAKTAEQQFKNIQVLKTIPADQLIPSMQFISGSLGVECEFCHVEGAFDKDEKRPKLAARKMIQMMFAINKDHFDGHRDVTCNTCHRGSAHPVSIPAIANETATPATDHSHEAAPEDEAEDGAHRL